MIRLETFSFRKIGIVFFAIALFLLSIDLLALPLAGMADSMTYLVSATSNPFIGLFIGLLLTAILQSSSTTTSLAVAAVASGSIDLPNAIPIILGANVGTTITSTIVAFGFITKAKEFRRAVSAAMIHDMFNILGVLLLFPLELKYHLLERASSQLASFLPTGQSVENGGFWFGQALDFLSNGILGLTGPVITLLLSILMLFVSIKLIAKILYEQLVGEREQQFRNVVFKNPFRAFGWGLGLTSVVQSSSLTTSLIVPLVATDKVRLGRAFHFLMGANIGTTITAIIAALFRSEAAMSLAVAHFLFNTTVVIIFAALPFIGRIPIYLAERLGHLMFRFRIAAFVYITLAFFAIPFGLIYLSNNAKAKTEQSTEQVTPE